MNQYLVIKYLGRGSSGRVFLCLSIDDQRLYAVKVLQGVVVLRGGGDTAGWLYMVEERPGRRPAVAAWLHSCTDLLSSAPAPRS